MAKTQVIPAYLKKYPEAVVGKALERYPLDYEMQYDSETGLPLWEVDVNAAQRHAYILGYMDAMNVQP
jgi:hypothetical protein